MDFISSARHTIYETGKAEDPEKGNLNSNHKQMVNKEEDDFAPVVKWAACAGRTDMIRKVTSKTSEVPTSKKLSSEVLGEALVSTAQNRHVEAAILHIN